MARAELFFCAGLRVRWQHRHFDLLALRDVRRRADCDALTALETLAQFKRCPVVAINADVVQMHPARVVHGRHAKTIRVE